MIQRAEEVKISTASAIGMTSAVLPSYFGVGSLASYTGLDQVGEGTYGYVYKAKDQRNGETVALKRLLFHKKSAGFPLNAVRELKFLKCLQHKNVVQLRDVVTSRGYEEIEKRVKTDSNRTVEEKKIDIEEAKNGGAGDILNLCGNLYLVFEFVEHDLGGLLDSKYRFNVREVKCIAKQLFEVLEFLAEKKVLHRDIKSSNILLTNRHQVKLADFGLARSIQSADGRDLRVDLTNNVVTMWYKAPELLLGAVRYSHSVDVWSTGCVIAELELGRPLFPGRTEIEQIDLICRTLGNPSEEIWSGLSRMPNYESLLQPLNNYSTTLKNSLSGKLSDGVIDLLDRVLVFDPLRRPSAKILLNHKYFLTQPLAPIDPADLEPLQVGAGVSFHEFRSKQQKRQRDVASDSSASVKAKFSSEGTSSNTSLPGFGGNSGSSNDGITTTAPVPNTSNVSISTIMANLSATIAANSLSMSATATGIASAGAMYTYTTGAAPPPPTLPPPVPLPTSVPFSAPLPFAATQPAPPTQTGVPVQWAPPPPRGPVGSVGPMNSSVGSGNMAINPRPPPPAAPINPPYGAGISANPMGYNTNSMVSGGGGVNTADVYGAPVVPAAPVAAPSMYNTYGAGVNTGVPGGASSAGNVYNQERSYGGRGGRGDNVYSSNSTGRGDYGGRGGGRGGRSYYPSTEGNSNIYGGGGANPKPYADPYSSSGSGSSGYGAPVAPVASVGSYGAAVNTSGSGSNVPYGSGYANADSNIGSYAAPVQTNPAYGGYGASVNPAPRSAYEGNSNSGSYGSGNTSNMYSHTTSNASHYGPNSNAAPGYPPSGSNTNNYNPPYGNAPPRGPPGGRGYNAYNNNNSNYSGGRGQHGNYQNRF